MRKQKFQYRIIEREHVDGDGNAVEVYFPVLQRRLRKWYEVQYRLHEGNENDWKSYMVRSKTGRFHTYEEYAHDTLESAQRTYDMLLSEQKNRIVDKVIEESK